VISILNRREEEASESETESVREEKRKQARKEARDAGGKVTRVGLNLTPGNEDVVLAKRVKNLT